LIYVLITKSVPSSLWSTSGTEQAKQGVGNSEQLIDNALIGIKLLPAIFFPARTSFIEYYYLVFAVNNLFLYASQAAVEAAPAVHAADYSADDTTLIGRNMANGTLFQTAQTGSYTGTGAIRQQMATALIQLGFNTLALSHDDQLNTTNYLDHPVLCYMSDTDEHHIGHA
jgi:hypothetical protein